MSLLAVCGIAYIVLYCVFPQTKDITWQAIDYICNKSLPVIGITALTLMFFIYKVIRFVTLNRATKISELKNKIEELENELKTLKDEEVTVKEATENFVNEVMKIIEKEQEKVKEICKTIPNKKVQLLGEKLYGDSKSKAEEI